MDDGIEDGGSGYPGRGFHVASAGRGEMGKDWDCWGEDRDRLGGLGGGHRSWSRGLGGGGSDVGFVIGGGIRAGVVCCEHAVSCEL